MIDTEIDWSNNCLTGGVHNGRPDAIWNIPLLYAAHIFTAEALQELVISRIYNDAMQIVEHHSLAVQKETGAEVRIYDQAWAERVKARAEERYLTTLAHKVGEIDRYYKSAGWQLEQQEASRRVKENKLNPHYKPLHDHDTINLLCRIIGSSAARNVA